MLDWLNPTSTMTETPFTWETVALRLGVAAIFGAAVALFYLLSHGREKDDSRPIMATLVLLSILIAMVSMVIGNSVARAFSLVGALSIVRFRTVVEDTRDTAFVIFAVIVGMAAGAGLILVPLLGAPIIGTTAIVLSHWPNSKRELLKTKCTLHVRVGLGRAPETILAETLNRYLEVFRVESTSTARQGAAIDLVYSGRLRQTASQVELITQLNQIEGIQSAEIRLV